jgi:hypothetical protein
MTSMEKRERYYSFILPRTPHEQNNYKLFNKDKLDLLRSFKSIVNISIFLDVIVMSIFIND